MSSKYDGQKDVTNKISSCHESDVSIFAEMASVFGAVGRLDALEAARHDDDSMIHSFFRLH